MNRKLWLAVAASVAVLALITMGAKAQAWTAFRSGSSATVPASETLDSSLWSGARNVDIAGTVNGDVFCGAQTVNISGSVKGDVICAAQTINISGSIEGSIRLAAQTVNLTGTVGRNATIVSQTINTDAKSAISGDASMAASTINLNGSIGRDLAATSSELKITGSLGRDLTTSAKNIVLATGAKIGGGIDYTSKNKINQSSGAQVGGSITQHQPQGENKSNNLLFPFGGKFAFLLVLMFIISALIITALLPQFVHRITNHGILHPWRGLATGLLASIVVPILAILLAITIVGIPVAILLVLSWLVISLSSGIFTAYLIGRRLWGSQRNTLLILLLGSVVLIILFVIPIVGIIALVLASWMGEGMILAELEARIPKPKYQVKRN
jgi:cytoskeletal protein CcmA (bactofilin family)